MKFSSFLFLCIIFSQALFSQTKINDGQRVSGTWTLSNSPYIVLGEAVVPEGSELTIEPGVIVKFKTGEDHDYRIDGRINTNFDVGFLRVQGKIVAVGTKDKRILFTGKGKGNWGNVVLDSRDSGNKFKYCTFEKSYFIRGIMNFTYTDDYSGEVSTMIENATGALSFINSRAMVEYCIFANNGWTAINCKQKSRPTLKNLTIYNNQYGLECNTQSRPTFISCILWGNRQQTFYINGDSKPHISFCLIQDYYLDEEYDKGNNVFAKDPLFINPERGDFRLSVSSPSYKTGIENQNMGSE